jgi:hypothetical protein
VNETMECAECGHRDGRLHLDQRVVTHPGNRTCSLPPRVQTPSLRPTKYPSPYRAPGGGAGRW